MSTTHGVLSDSEIKRAIKQGWIAADAAFLDDQIQPASLDLRLGDTAFRLRASFLPGAGAKVADRLDGALSCTSTLGHGATFAIRLPIAGWAEPEREQ